MHAQLITRVGRVACALPIEVVVETMRPLPIEPLADPAAGVCGLAIVRGAPIPVVDLAAVLGVTGTPGRFVVVRAGERRIALVVDAVDEIRRLDDAAVAELPPLLREARGELIARIGRLDEALMVVLDVARLVPEAA